MQTYAQHYDYAISFGMTPAIAAEYARTQINVSVTVADATALLIKIDAAQLARAKDQPIHPWDTFPEYRTHA